MQLRSLPRLCITSTGIKNHMNITFFPLQDIYDIICSDGLTFVDESILSGH